MCDGTPDCTGGEDEKNCDRVCDVSCSSYYFDGITFQFQLENSFKCARSKKDKCIPVEQRCDGIWHCEDRSDEMNCRKVGFDESGEWHFFINLQCPSENTFMCDGNCHPDWVRCDGLAHCADGSDELGCTCQGELETI